MECPECGCRDLKSEYAEPDICRNFLFYVCKNCGLDFDNIDAVRIKLTKEKEVIESELNTYKEVVNEYIKEQCENCEQDEKEYGNVCECDECSIPDLKVKLNDLYPQKEKKIKFDNK